MPLDREAYLRALYPSGLHHNKEKDMDETKEGTKEEAAKNVKIGDIVHYVLPTGKYIGDHRPAIVLRLWGLTCVQLSVFTDHFNDFGVEYVAARGLLWATSVSQNEDTKVPGTWHWPEEM